MISIDEAMVQDLDSILEMHTSSIRKYCSRHYTEEQINSWTSALSVEMYRKGMGKLDFRVARKDNRIHGLCIYDTRNAELMALYVDARLPRQGIGSILLDYAEKEIRLKQHRQLKLEATINAVPFYLSKGYLRKSENIFILPDGVEIPCAVMVKPLL